MRGREFLIGIVSMLAKMVQNSGIWARILHPIKEENYCRYQPKFNREDVKLRPKYKMLRILLLTATPQRSADSQ